MQNIIQTFDSNINNILQDYVKKPTLIRGVIHLLLMLYVVRLAPQPPAPVLQLFDNIYFKLFIFSLVLWTAQFSPSTSILIALAFLVTMNYVNTGKVWEYLENIKANTVPVAPVSTATAVEAVKVLAEAAASPVPAAPEVVKPVAEIATAASTTQQGVDAIKTLASQAIKPSAASVKDVAELAQIAVNSIAPAPVAPAPAPEPEPEPIEKPVGAPAPEPIEKPVGAPVPAEVEKPVGAPVPAEVEKPVGAPVAAEVEKPVGAPVAAASPAADAQVSGCYPLRKYDMSLVKPHTSGVTYEDYQSFQITTQ
jgi:hypothetical protein